MENLVLKISNYFKKPSPKIGSVGIYKYTWSYNTTNENYRGVDYDVYIKVKAIDNYDGLIEVDILDINVNEKTNDCIMTLINADLPKYIDNKFIKWKTNE